MLPSFITCFAGGLQAWLLIYPIIYRFIHLADWFLKLLLRLTGIIIPQLARG